MTHTEIRVELLDDQTVHGGPLGRVGVIELFRPVDAGDLGRLPQLGTRVGAT